MAKGKKTGGRQKGALNKSTADVKAMAQNYTEKAFQALEHIMLYSESDAARVSAIKEILDRAYGKSAQAVTGEITFKVGLADRLDKAFRESQNGVK